jgi:putative transposase
MASIRRRLPHVYPAGKWLFVTWHLHGSLPRGVYPPATMQTAGRAFVWMDRYLDSARVGPRYLAQPEIAQIVVESLHKGVELAHFQLGAYVVMANHVHALVLPLLAPEKLMQSMKGSTARWANLALGRTGETFWQRESYDHWVRDEAEFQRIVRYIEENPVKAGVVRRAEDYPWSSASSGTRLNMSVETAS